jgi:CxxC motif-containing protein
MTVKVVNGEVTEVTGNGCKRGIPHAMAEAVNPVRTLTTTVRLCGADRPLLPVRTNKPVPRALLREMVQLLNGITVSAPVEEGSIVVADILGTGADIVATRPVCRV